MSDRVSKLSRRELLRLGLGASVAGSVGLGLGIYGGYRYELRQKRIPDGPEVFRPSVFLAIDTEGETTVWVTRAEMGQGVATALPMLIAEELEADWTAIRIALAPASSSYGNQLTAASASIRSMHRELREAGAIAREMLIAAAAESWGVEPRACEARDGAVIHRATGRRLRFGALAERAGELEVPAAPALKNPDQFRVIGRPTDRLDAPSKVDGSAVYGLDVRVAGLRFASIERPSQLGAPLLNHDEAAARAVPGVLDVLAVEAGVAVVAETTAAALAGRRALDASFGRGPHADFSSQAFAAELASACRNGGASARSVGDVNQALREAAQRIEASYALPFLAHGCMEPINATAQLRDGRLEIWAPTQDPQRVRREMAERAGLTRADCHVHVPFLGGGFGRRTAPIEVRDAVELAQRLSPNAVQVFWSREDDIRHDLYRTASAHRLEAGLDEAGNLLAWRHRLATASDSGDQSSEGDVDGVAVGGARGVPYTAQGLEVLWTDVRCPVPTGIWRSVGHSYNAFAVESFIDEAAHAAARDPLDYRLSQLAGAGRERAVLRRVAELSEWFGAPPAEGKARGVAVHGCFGSVCAMVAEVSRSDSGGVRVERVWAAVECGWAINPRGIEAQVEGGIVFGLGAALHGEVRFEEGGALESNFHDFRVLRFDEMPQVSVAILDSPEEPSGVGEVGVPPIGPAVANAWFALTGERLREMPFRPGPVA